MNDNNIKFVGVAESLFLAALLVFASVPIVSFADEQNNCENEIVIVSDTSNQVAEGSLAVATYSQNPRWTASIPGATWIWKTFFVQNPLEDEFATFTKTFDISATSTIDSASLIIASDNSYT